MGNPFSLKQVPSSTRSELIARGVRKWNPSLGEAKTWIHVSSMAEGANEALVLKDFKTFRDAYNIDNRPNIVIRGFKIGAKGEFGTTRQATLDLTIFDDNYFNKFSADYLIPDMSIRVQFGWSVDSDGKPSPSPITGQDLDSKSIRRMQKLSNSNPTYEGFQGRVLGWDVKLVPDINAWDITLTLVGAADAVAETSVVHVSQECNCKKEITGQTAEGNDEKQEVIEKTSDLEAALLQVFEDPANLNRISSLQGAPNLLAEEIAYPGFSRDFDGTEDTSGFLWIDADLDARETFVSWGTVEAMLTRLSGQEWGSTGKPASYILDSSDVILKTPLQNGSKWFSADPRVCILPGGGLTFEEPTEWTDYLNINIAGFDTGIGVGSLIDSFVGEGGFPQASGNCFISDQEVRLVDIMISTVHLNKRAKEFSQNPDGAGLVSAISALLKDINVACGNVWELELLDASIDNEDEDAPTILKIIDANDASNAVDTFIIRAAPANSGFCRNIQLEFKPTDAMKTQALYGAQRNQTGKGIANNKPCATRFLIFTQDGKKSLGKPAVGDRPKTCETEVCQESNQTEDPVAALQKEPVGLTINSARNYLMEQKQKADLDALSAATSYCTSPLLPIQFSATFTGVSGFRWGQVVSCDRLPQEVRNSLIFQVTAVEHTLTVEDWVTTVNTVARTKF